MKEPYENNTLKIKYKTNRNKHALLYLNMYFILFLISNQILPFFIMLSYIFTCISRHNNIQKVIMCITGTTTLKILGCTSSK